MKKILSILIASAIALSPLSVSAESVGQKASCGIVRGVLEKVISERYCSENESCICDISDILDKLPALKDFIYAGSSGSQNGSSKPQLPPNNEAEKPEIKPEDKPSVPNIPTIPSTPEVKPQEKPDTDIVSPSASKEEAVIELVNSYRKQNGLSPLSYDKKLSEAAQLRAKEQEALFSHTRPNGSRCFTALDEFGISYHGAGENIAAGQTSADEVMTDWMNSQGHRENILNPSFTKIGVGLHKGSDGRYYWAQMFIY